MHQIVLHFKLWVRGSEEWRVNCRSKEPWGCRCLPSSSFSSSLWKSDQGLKFSLLAELVGKRSDKIFNVIDCIRNERILLKQNFLSGKIKGMLN